MAVDIEEVQRIVVPPVGSLDNVFPDAPEAGRVLPAFEIGHCPEIARRFRRGHLPDGGTVVAGVEVSVDRVVGHRIVSGDPDRLLAARAEQGLAVILSRVSDGSGDVGGDGDDPVIVVVFAGAVLRDRQKAVLFHGVEVDAHPDLLEVVDAADGVRPGARLVQGRQQHAGQNRDDGDDDQKLDQREVPDFPVHGEYLSVIG